MRLYVLNVREAVDGKDNFGLANGDRKSNDVLCNNLKLVRIGILPWERFDSTKVRVITFFRPLGAIHLLRSHRGGGGG